MITDHLKKDEAGRFPAINIFRGVAIFTMLAANAAAESLAPPHSFLVRIYGSFAAPIFVFLAGFMVAAGAAKHNSLYFFRRGAEVIITGALIDLFIWKIVPFTTFDVLYLTGFGIFIAGLSMRLKTSLRILLMLLCLVAGPLLQHFFSYHASVSEFSLADFSTTPMPAGISWWFRSWLIDGWFPVLPWLGLVLAGSLVFTHGSVIVKQAKVFIPAGILLFIGAISWLYFHRPIAEREGYSELFYPPGIAYLCAATGVLITGICLLPYLKPRFGLQLLEYLGACSLFIYILHSAVIMFFLDEYFTGLPLRQFLLMYIVFAAAMIFCAWLLHILKKKIDWKKMPQPVKFIFGG